MVLFCEYYASHFNAVMFGLSVTKVWSSFNVKHNEHGAISNWCQLYKILHSFKKNVNKVFKVDVNPNLFFSLFRIMSHCIQFSCEENKFINLIFYYFISTFLTWDPASNSTFYCRLSGVKLLSRNQRQCCQPAVHAPSFGHYSSYQIVAQRPTDGSCTALLLLIIKHCLKWL